VATDDEAGPVRRNALVALAKTGAAGEGTITDRLKHDPHAGVREYAARFLPRVLDDEATTVRLLAALLARDPEAFVRAKAATALGEIGSDRAVEVLETHGVDDRSDDVGRAAERALAVARGEPSASVDADPRAPGGGPGASADRRGPRPNATVPSPDAVDRRPGGDRP
jgi:HEAT repeat protein